MSLVAHGLDANSQLRSSQLRIVLVIMAIDEQAPQVFEPLTAQAPDWMK